MAQRTRRAPPSAMSPHRAAIARCWQRASLGTCSQQHPAAQRVANACCQLRGCIAAANSSRGSCWNAPGFHAQSWLRASAQPARATASDPRIRLTMQPSPPPTHAAATHTQVNGAQHHRAPQAQHLLFVAQAGGPRRRDPAGGALRQQALPRHRGLPQGPHPRRGSCPGELLTDNR
jgi:hypothetical protein